MEAGANTLDRAGALAALAWWREAGVDTLVDDQPRIWFADPAPRAEASPAPVEKPPEALPATLPAFARWLAEAETLPDGSTAGRRVLPEGDPAAAIMVLLDMPSSADALLDGAAGALFDRMLAAIGRDRGSIYLTSLTFARPPTGRIDPALFEDIASLARHHVALAAPRRLLLVGEAASRALAGTELAAARNRLLAVNHSGGTTEAVATLTPAILLGNPALKAESWKDLRRLIGGLEP